jgi:putative acetyltransferase
MNPPKAITIKRTESSDPDFPFLVAQLNQELRGKYGDLQSVYEQFNLIGNLDTVVIAYSNDSPAGCGCFKKVDDNTIEIKRMFVKPDERKHGFASGILNELETWAKEDGYIYSIAETVKKQQEAITFYQKNGYKIIPNYGQYIGMESSICFRKRL